MISSQFSPLGKTSSIFQEDNFEPRNRPRSQGMDKNPRPNYRYRNMA